MITLGTDPEFFAFSEKEELISADKLFPGKHKPHKFEDGQAVFFDGVQGEFNINPATTAAQLHANIMAAIERTKKEFKVDIKFKSTVEVNPEDLKNADPECNRFGCDPDYDIYTLKERVNEIDAKQHPYRYAGGHLHIGNIPEEISKHHDRMVMFIKALDVFVGARSVIDDHSEETKIRRSYHYGQAGSFRVQEYGIEYRALSNYWVGNEEFTKTIVDGVNEAIEATISGRIDKILEIFGEDEAKEIINTVNVERAKKFLEEIKEIH